MNRTTRPTSKQRKASAAREKLQRFAGRRSRVAAPGWGFIPLEERQTIVAFLRVARGTPIGRVASFEAFEAAARLLEEATTDSIFTARAEDLIPSAPIGVASPDDLVDYYLLEGARVRVVSDGDLVPAEVLGPDGAPDPAKCARFMCAELTDAEVDSVVSLLLGEAMSADTLQRSVERVLCARRGA
jgi:hypothetical protein